MTSLDSDDLDPSALGRRLQGLELARAFFYFDSLGSTNSFMRSLSGERLRHGTLAVANTQTAGRGRFDRRWLDAPGKSLLFSLLLEAGRPAAVWPLLTLGAAVGVCRALERERVIKPRIRWPNDVLIGGAKVCGILTEKTEAAAVLVLGVGLNVHQQAEDFPAQLHGAATSLHLAAPGKTWRRDDLLVTFLEDFADVYRQWCQGSDKAILADCRRRMSTLGRPVKVHTHGRTAEGVVMDLDETGGLVLREPTGIVSRWHSADVEEIEWSA